MFTTSDDGGVNVREDAADWYLRTRSELLKSAIDFVDYDNAVANFYLAKMNLARQGYGMINDPLDDICNYILKEELDDEEMSATVADRKKLEQFGRKRKTGISDIDAGLNLIADRHHWSDRFSEASMHDFMSLFPDAERDEASVYPDAHYFQADYHPLRYHVTTSGLPVYLETIRDLYMPVLKNGELLPSMAEQIQQQERMHENHYKESEAIDGFLRDGVKQFHSLGPLGDKGMNDIYMDNLENWKDNNRDLVDSIISSYKTPAEQEYFVRKAHMDESLEKMADTSTDENGRRTSLGWGGYTLGLEWYSPEQRDIIGEHLLNQGSTSEQSQKINISNDTLSVGRIKRNIAHRFTPEFFHYMRGIIFPAQNQRKYYEGEDDILNYTMSKHSTHMNPYAIHSSLVDSVDDEGLSYYDKILSAINDKFSDEEPLENLNFLSKLRDTKGVLDSKSPRDLMSSLSDDNVSVKVDMNALMKFLGYKRKRGVGSNDEFLPTGKGIFEDSTNPISIDDMSAILESSGAGFVEKLRKNKKNRMAESHAHLGFNGPNFDDVPEDEADLWMNINGNPIGHGAIFNFPYKRGGHGRDALHFLEKLMKWSPKDENGDSLLGSISDAGILSRSGKNGGLFGRYIPRAPASKGMTPLDELSLWGSSSSKRDRRVSGMKNHPYQGHSTLNPSLANELASLTMNDKIDRGLPRNTNQYLDGTPLHAHDPIRARMTENASGRHSGNAKLKVNVHTRMGRTHPITNPREKAILTTQEIGLPQHSESRVHASNSPNLFNDFLGIGRKRQEKEMNLDYEEEVLAIEEEIDDVRAKIEMYAGGDEEPPEELFIELENAISKLDELRESAMDVVGSKEHKLKHSSFETNKMADHEAIVKMAEKIKPIYEAADPEAFDPKNKMKFLANTKRLLFDANRMLIQIPHSAHGFTTHRPGIDSIVPESASELASELAEGKIIPHKNLAFNAIKNGVPITRKMKVSDVMEALGFPYDTNHRHYEAHRNVAQSVLDSIPDEVDQIFAITNGSLLSADGLNFHPRGIETKLDYEPHTNHIDEFVNEWDNSPEVIAAREKMKNEKATGKFGQRGFRDKGLKALKSKYVSRLQVMPQLMKLFAEEGEKYGLQNHSTGEVLDIRGNQNKTAVKSLLHNVLTVNPSAIDPNDLVTDNIHQNTKPVDKLVRRDGREIHPAYSLRGATISDLYTSDLLGMGYSQVQPTVGVEWNGNEIVAGTNMPSSQTLHTVSKEVMDRIHGSDVVDSVLALPGELPQSPAALRPNLFQGGASAFDDPLMEGKSEDVLTALMNPDILMKNDGDKPHPILPMHRIFSIKDFDALRGFSGEWAVSMLPDGERFMVRRKGSRVSAYSSDGDYALSEQDRKQFRAITDGKNFLLDAVKHGDEIHIVDILEYDDSNIADMNVRERLKVLRGQFDSHEHIIIPGPHNLRLTDDEGLEGAISDMEGDRILLRDATSTYMRGEQRHPKWFLLRPDKKVSLIILDVRGKGPYTYRLGAGPLDAEGLGNRGVDYEGKSYLDVGTVSSPKPFEEGQIVNVSVSGVKSKKRSGKTIYDVTTSKIVGESDDSPASLETLSLLTKSQPVIPVHFTVELEGTKLMLNFPDVDTVVYKMSNNRHGIWAHSPKSTLGELMKSDYPLKLAESVRPLWSPAASLIIKGIEPKEDRERSMSKPKNRENSEEQSAGIIDADDEMTILKPNKIESMAKTLMRIADLVDRLEKEKMSGGPGARGLGIDVGSQIESPRGPTSLTSEQSLPDWDMKERPTEDPESEYPSTRRARENRKQSSVYEAESENE